MAVPHHTVCYYPGLIIIPWLASHNSQVHFKSDVKFYVFKEPYVPICALLPLSTPICLGHLESINNSRLAYSFSGFVIPPPTTLHSSLS